MRQMKTVPSVSNLIYPTVCGICGKVNSNSLCKKCEIRLNKELNIYIEKQVSDKYFNELISVFKYEGQIRKLILDYKFNEKSYLYSTFVNFLLNDKKLFENIKSYDTIVPVPISRKRYRERGYNQSLLIAKEIAKQTNLLLIEDCLLKTKNIIEQSKLNKEDRENNIKGVYELKNKQIIDNKKVLLIDDIYTTGSTVNECSKILRKGNVAKIGVLTLAKD